MSINPQQARNEPANQLVAEYERLELILLELISTRLARGMNAPDWAQRQLTEITTFRTAARTLVGKMAGTSAKLLDAAMRQSIKDGKAAATADVAKAEKALPEISSATPGHGLPPTPAQSHSSSTKPPPQPPHSTPASCEAQRTSTARSSRAVQSPPSLAYKPAYRQHRGHSTSSQPTASPASETRPAKPGP